MSPRRLRRIGARLGRLTYSIGARRRRVVLANLAACFSDRAEGERQRLARAHFAELGAMAAEVTSAWFAHDADVKTLAWSLQGLEHVEAQQQRGRGVLLISGHFTTMELSARLLATRLRFGALYRRHQRPAMERVVVSARERYIDPLLPKEKVRAALRLLRGGGVLWFAPDQHYKGVDAVTAPFLGVPARTITTPATLARLTDAAVIGLHQRRDERGLYHVRLSPPLDGFPSDDAVTDATRINELVAANVRAAPTQYLWTHRRFKGQGLYSSD